MHTGLTKGDIAIQMVDVVVGDSNAGASARAASSSSGALTPAPTTPMEENPNSKMPKPLGPLKPLVNMETHVIPAVRHAYLPEIEDEVDETPPPPKAGHTYMFTQRLRHNPY